ncbi:MAG: FG-GAP repeat protein, partial [Bacteroidota bacterium]
MKTFYRQIVLATSFALSTFGFVAFAQVATTQNFSHTELAFLRERLELDRPAADRKQAYQISTNPEMDDAKGRVYIHKQLDNNEVSLATLAPKELPTMAYFGFSTDMEGEMVVVGAPGDGSKRTGAAYVFRKSGKVWKKVAQLTANDGEIRDDFGYSVRIVGNFIYVGAPGADNRYE